MLPVALTSAEAYASSDRLRRFLAPQFFDHVGLVAGTTDITAALARCAMS